MKVRHRRQVTDEHRRRDLANLAELERWTKGDAPGPAPTPGWEVKARPETPEPEVAPAIAPAATAHRPQSITDLVGQEELRNQLAIVVNGTRKRGKVMPHVLLSGPAGYGKTTLAGIVAHELGWHFVEQTGMSLRDPKAVVGVLMKLEPCTVLFVDEIHELPKPVQTVLYEVLEDGKLSTTMGVGTDATPYTHHMQGFVLVGATTEPGALTTPMRDRFGFHGRMDIYTEDELGDIVARSWQRQGVDYDPGEPHAVGQRCKGTPRRALQLSDRVLDYGACHDVEDVGVGLVHEALEAFHIDALGLDDVDYRIIEALAARGTPIGLDALAQYLDMDQKTLRDEHEPYLCRIGLMARQRGGRMATAAARDLVRESEPLSASEALPL